MKLITDERRSQEMRRYGMGGSAALRHYTPGGRVLLDTLSRLVGRKPDYRGCSQRAVYFKWVHDAADTAGCTDLASTIAIATDYVSERYPEYATPTLKVGVGKRLVLPPGSPPLPPIPTGMTYWECCPPPEWRGKVRPNLTDRIWEYTRITQVVTTWTLQYAG